jgi:hypothetical protein
LRSYRIDRHRIKQERRSARSDISLSDRGTEATLAVPLGQSKERSIMSVKSARPSRNECSPDVPEKPGLRGRLDDFFFLISRVAKACQDQDVGLCQVPDAIHVYIFLVPLCRSLSYN